MCAITALVMSRPLLPIKKRPAGNVSNVSRNHDNLDRNVCIDGRTSNNHSPCTSSNNNRNCGWSVVVIAVMVITIVAKAVTELLGVLPALVLVPVLVQVVVANM